MIKKDITNIEHIIAKLDNDFNLDNSDWIPRIASWSIEAMQLLNVSVTEKKRRKVIINDRIGILSYPINANNVRVYSSKECLIEKAKYEKIDGCSLYGGVNEDQSSSNTSNDNNIPSIDPSIGVVSPSNTIFQEIYNPSMPPRYNVYEIYEHNEKFIKNYVLINNDKIEINYDDDFIYVESDEIITLFSDAYNCDLPVIPNNSLLLEAIAAWCMYKILCRGYKHQVLNLRDNSPALNPYIMWLDLRERARTSVIIDQQGNVLEDTNVWNNAFYYYTFDPKRK